MACLNAQFGTVDSLGGRFIAQRAMKTPGANVSVKIAAATGGQLSASRPNPCATNAEPTQNKKEEVTQKTITKTIYEASGFASRCRIR